jgi:hypothetical protein
VDKSGLAKSGLVIGVQFAQPSSQWEAKVKPEEMSQTLLTNKKQGNLDMALTLSSQS